MFGAMAKSIVSNASKGHFPLMPPASRLLSWRAIAAITGSLPLSAASSLDDLDSVFARAQRCAFWTLPVERTFAARPGHQCFSSLCLWPEGTSAVLLLAKDAGHF